MPLPPTDILYVDLWWRQFQSLGRAQCLCHGLGYSRDAITIACVSIARSRSMPLPLKTDSSGSPQVFEFQSLGRAQCLCHASISKSRPSFLKCFNRSVALNASATWTMNGNSMEMGSVSIARSRSMPLPLQPIATELPISSSFNRSVALNASATHCVRKGRHPLVRFQSLGRAQCLCHNKKRLTRVCPPLAFQSLGRAQCLCHKLKIRTSHHRQAMFQSLGRAQCLCHSLTQSRMDIPSCVSIARSRSMPLPLLSLP